MKWFRKSHANVSTVAGCANAHAGDAQCTMHDAQLRKGRAGRRWTAAAAAWVLAAGTLLGSAREAWAWAWAQAWGDHTSQTFYVGDMPCFTWWFNGDGHDASDKEWSLDKGTRSWKSGSSYIYKESGTDGGNTQWETTGIRVTSSGTWYYSLFLGWGSNRSNGHYYNYNSGEWSEGSGSVVTSSFTVNDLNNPTAGTLTPSYKSVTVNWTKGTSGVAKDTLVLRSTSSTKPTPVGGTTYNTGDTVTLGGNSYKVVHRGNATSATDSGLEPGTTYYYYFYAENNTYYSSGVYKSTTTTSPSGDNVYWSSSSGATSGAWEQSGKNLWYYTSLAGDYPKVNTWGAQNVYIDNDFKPDQYLTEDTSVKSLTYNTTTAHKLYGSNAMTAVTGSTLTLGGGLTNKVNGTHVIGAKVALGAATTMDIQAGGIIVSGVVSGAYAITKKGTGTLTLSATNTYSGGTTINAGTVMATMAKSLGTGAATIASDATLELNPAAARTLANTFTVNGGTIKNTAKANVLSKAVTLGADSTVEVAASSLRLTGAVGGSYKLTKTGAGTLILCGTNTYSGGTAVSEGTLTASNSATAMGTGTVTLSSGTTLNLNPVTAKTYANTLVVNGATIKNTIKDNVLSGGVTLGGNSTVNVAEAADTLTMSGIINSGTSSYGLTKSGSGTLKLSGVNTYKGATAVSAGTLQFTDASGLGTTAGATTVASDATLNYAPASTGTTVSEPVTLNGGTLSLTANNATWGGAVTLGANSKVSAASSKNLTVTGIISGSGKTLTKEGDGTVTLGAANTYSGATTVNAGTLAIANGGAIAGNLSVASGATASVTKNSGVTWTYGGVVSGSGSFTKAGAGTLIVTGANTFDGTTTVSAGTLQIGNGGTTGSWADDMGGSGTVAFNRSDAITYAGVLSGTLKLAKEGTGTLTLSGTSTMSGATTVSAGTLLLSGSLASSAVTVESGGTLSASGTPSVGSLTVKSGGALTVSRANTLSSGGAADLKNGAVVNFDASGWSKTGSTMSWTIFAGGAAASVGTVTLNVTAATGTSAGEYTIAASGNNVVVTWTKATTAPVIGSPTAASIAPTSATLGGTVTSDGNDTITEYGVVWSTSANPTTGSHAGGGISTASGAPTIDSAFTRSATGLTAGTTYHYRAYAKNGVGTSYTDDATFTAPTVVGLSKVTFTYPGAGNTLTLTGTGGSGSGAYSYAIQSTSGSAAGSIGTGANYNKLTVTACGTTSATGSFTIRVTKAADAPYASQYADVVVTVNKASQTLTFANSTFGADTDSHTVSATGLGSPTITYTGNADAVATVTSAGAMTRGTTGYGTVTVTASAAESANYLSATKTATVTVMGKRPTSNPTKLTFTATGTTTANIVVRRASDSTGIVIVMRAGAAPTTAPTDGSKPTANTAYGTAGAALGNGYVVYAHTGGGSSDYTVNVTGLTAGTKYYVEAYPYQGGSSTYSYKSTAKEVIGYTPAAPVTTASATADGKTMVRLSWSKPAGASGTMVVWEGTTEPTQGTTYAVGATTLGGKVLYRSTDDSKTLEHVVPAGATYTYKFYAYSSADAYSEALARTASLGSFGSGEIVDTFSYTNGASLSGLNGANGWTNSWVISGTGPTIVSQTGSSIPVFTNYTEYPGNTGNRMKVAMNSDAANFAATRGFPAVSSGTIYAAAIMSYHYAGANKWCRIALQDGDTAKMAAGRIWESSDDKTIGIDDCNGSRTHGTYNLNPWETSTNNDYLVIMKYDFSTKTISALAYYHGEAVPSEAPTTWHVTKTLTANFPSKLNKVSLQAGSDAGGYTGDVYFDEVRVATSWSKLLQQEAVAPNPPTSVTATADGNEMVRVGWTKNASGNGVMVLATTDGTTPAAPAAGTAYSQGATVGGTTKVAYKGTGTDADLVVAPGTTVKVAVYSYNGDNLYSTAETPAAVTTGTYESWENLETFSYTNGVQVSASGNSWKGGQVWGDNYWGSSGSGNWIPLKPAEVPSYLVNHVVNYPDSVGNVMCVTNLGDGQNATLNRVVSPSVGGSYNNTIYFAYRMAYRYSEAGKNRWAGLQLVSHVGGAEKTVFVGKAAATDHQYHLGINATGASSPCWPDVGSGGNAYELKGTYDYEKSAYVVVGKIQWTADNVANVYANAFYTGDGDAELPENEPGWGSFGYNGASMGPIDSIQFLAGADSGHGQIGFAYFDELRWGTSWEQLLAGKAPTDVWMDGQTTYVYAGDTVTNAITSTPKGAKQSAQSLIWETASPVSATWEANAIPAAFYTNKESDTQTEWHGLHLITNKTAVTRYGLGAVSGNGTTVKSQNHGEATYQKHTYSVKVLPAPTLSSVTGGDFKETIRWTRATGYNSTGSSSSGRTFSEVMVVRYSSSAASTAALPPVDGKTYFPGDVIYYNNDPTDSKYMTVVYRGSDATSYVDTGLAKNTTYYYAVFTVNNSYYSAKSTVKSATTTGTSTTPVVDGLTTDWVGGASPTKNSAAYSEEEFIWTDKALEGRKDTDACRFADIGEFRIKATASTVYFLLRLTNSTAASVRPTNTYVVVGVDTRRNASSTAMNWLGDESATFVGGGYYQTNAAIHYPERQMAVHYVGGSENHWQVEMYADNGADWYAPQNGDWAAACSADNSTDPCIEWSVPRADLGLTGAGIGRFTIATFVNSGVWNNQGVGTVRIEHDSCAAVDAAEIVPYGVNDQDGLLGAWDEGLKNGNVNFWADVRFTAAGLSTHTAPTVPASTGTGTNGPGSPLLQWTASTDTDGFVTGYLLEVATNAAFGTLGDTLLYRVNLEGASTTSFKTRTSVSNFYWRVRARDSAGILSSAVANPYTVEGRKDNDGPVAKLLYVGTNVMAFINNTGGYRDDQERSGDATSVEDRDLRDGGKVFGFVIEWYDVNGVYATNVNRDTGGFAWNILAEHSGGEPYGRVSPNWDLLIIDRKTPAGTAPSPETVDGNPKAYSWKEGLVLPTENGGTETIDCWYIDCGKDAVFTNDYGVTQVINDGNFGQYVTNYVTNAFTFGGYRDGIELYLTVSAEDGNTDTGNEETSGDKGWWPWPYWVDGSAGSYGDDPRPTVNSSGYCKDGPHKARNVTTNQLLKFYVRDNDVRPPVASTNLWGADATDASGAKFTPSLVVATSAVTKAQASGAWSGIPGKVAPISGAGRDTVYQLTDQALGRNLTFLFNAYDEYLHSGLQLGNTRTATVSTRILTNTTAMVRTWDAESGEWTASDENWADYKSALSTIYDINPTTGAEAVGTAGTGPDTVLVWDFGTLTEGNIDSLFGVNNILSYISTNSAGTTNLVQLHLRDRDNDRDGDQADTELTFGRMMFTDDDATAPEVSGDALLGTGTNAVEFGTLIGWTYNAPGASSTNLGVATNMTSMTSNVLWGIKGSTGATIQNTKWLQLTMPKETAVTLGSSPHFQFDIAGRQGTEWTADTLVFEQRVTSTGPTNFLLTVMEPAGLATNAAVVGGEVQSGWALGGNTQFEKLNGQYRFRMTGTAGGSASLTGPSVSTAGKQVARLAFRVGWYGAESEGTLTVACSGTTLGIFTKDSFMVTNDSVVSLQTAAAGHWLDVEYDLPLNAADVASWTATGLVGGNGFVVRDAEVITQTGYGDEQRLIEFNMPKDPGEASTWNDTTNHVSAIWSNPLTTAVAGGGVRRFRLYGWAATSTSAKWGISDVRLCGIASAPKGFQVTDADLVSGSWTNVLEVIDGQPEGYDTVKSGISVTNGAAAHQTNAPVYTLLKPDGTAAKSGTYGLLGLTEAQYTALQETSFASGWTFTGGAESYEYAKAREGTRVLRLPGGDGTAASATRAVAMAYGEIGEGNISGATISGTLSLRALSTEAGMDNTVAVTLALLDGSGNEIVSKTETLPSPHMARWDEMRLEPLSLESKTVRQARITIAQANAAGSEVYVDDLDLTLTLWGAEADMAGKTAAQVRAYNGLPGVKLRLATEALSSAAATMPLSSEITSGNTLYTLESTVYDADADRSNDGLSVTMASQFALYDDDDVAPQTGSMFGGGPLGVSIGGTLIPGASRSGSGTNLEWSVTDDALAKAGYAGVVRLGLNVYDYSGWDTTSLALGSDAIQTGSTTASGYSRTAPGDTANLPSATNEWTTTAGTLWNKYKGDFATEDPAKRTVTAILRDRDANRANDDSAVTTQVARIWFIDQDVGEQAWASKNAGYQYMVISTNVPEATTDMRNVITNANPVSPNTVVNPYALGGYAAHKGTAASARSFTIYDGDLRNVAPDNLFVVTANIYDKAGSGKGRSATGLRRTSTETTSKTASVVRWKNTAGAETITITNTYVAFETATAGTVGAAEVLSRVTINSNLSGSQANTKISTGNGHTSWAWSSFSAADVGALLPEEYGTALNPSRDLYLNIHAYDIDTNRPNDQVTTWLAGPRITVRDDDTTPPNAPASVWVNEEPVASGTIDRDTAPWQKSLSSVKVEWTEALDPEPAGFGTVGNDIKVAGIAGYWLADPGATPGVGDATALTDTTTNATTHKVSKTLTGLTILQGCGNYQLYAMDKDADRPGDARAGAAANVPLALDYTKPTAVPLTGHGTGASTDGVDDPTTQMDISWTATGVGPDDPVGDKTNYDAIPAAEKTAAAAQGRATTDILSPWLTYKVYYREYDPQAVETQAASESKSAAQIILRDYVQAATFGEETAGWLAVTNDAPIADPSAGKTKYDTLGTNVTSSVRVYDLDFDREYLFVVVGVDKAGNEGPVNDYSWATNNTIKFAITQGLVRTSAKLNADIRDGAGTGMSRIPTDTTNAPKHGAALYWMAAGQTAGRGEVKKQYDFIYRDAASFDERGDEEWSLVGTVRTNWNYQTDGLDTVNDNLRFFRASYKGRWQGEKPLASEEVYSMNNVVLSEGWNYVSLQGVPWTNTFRGVFGTDTDMWPGTATMSDEATKVVFYKAGTSTLTNESYWFGSSGGNGVWYNNDDQDVTDRRPGMKPASGERDWYAFTANGGGEGTNRWTNLDGTKYYDYRTEDGKWYEGGYAEGKTGLDEPPFDNGFFARPFAVVLPQAVRDASGEVVSGWWLNHSEYDGAKSSRSQSVKAMLWHPVMQVPTNGPAAGQFSQTVTGGKDTYNLLSLNLPVAVHPKQLGLVATDTNGVPVAGRMHASDDSWVADKLYTIDPATKDVRTDSMMYCDGAGKWRWVAGDAEVSGTPIKPNDMLVVVIGEHAAAEWTWTYSPTNFYKLPTRHMGRPPQ